MKSTTFNDIFCMILGIAFIAAVFFTAVQVFVLMVKGIWRDFCDWWKDPSDAS